MHPGHESVEEANGINLRPIVTNTMSTIQVPEDTEHVYAVLEQTHLQQPTTVVQLNSETIEEDQQTELHLISETIPNHNGFQYVTNQAGLKSRSVTWASAQQSTVRPKPKQNLELVQIYDNVMIESERRAVARDSGPSYPGNYRKHSLPTYLGEHQHSNASQDCPMSSESDKNTDESIPIYSQPDINKKREERRKKREQKEQEERMAAMQKISSTSCPPLPQVTELEREQKNEPSIRTDSGAAIDEQQQTDTDLKFEKHFDEQNNNPGDKVLMGKDECLYDEPISLNLVPKKSKTITERKEKEEGGEEELP